MDPRGLTFILTAAFLWSLIGVFTQFILAEGVGALEIAFWRAMFGWLFFAIHAKAINKIKLPLKDAPPVLGFGVVCVTMFYSAYQLAIRDVGVAVGAVLLYTAPAWVALLSWVVLRERMTALKLVCVALTISGVAAISLGPSIGHEEISLNFFGLIAGLTSGFTYALYYIFGKKYLHRYETPTIFTYALPFGALLLLPFVEFSHKSPTAWLLLVGIGAVCSYGAFTAYYKGLERMDTTQAAVVATFEPVSAAIMAFVLFGESFGAWGYAGSALVLGAVLLMVVADRKAAGKQEILE